MSSEIVNYTNQNKENISVEVQAGHLNEEDLLVFMSKLYLVEVVSQGERPLNQTLLTRSVCLSVAKCKLPNIKTRVLDVVDVKSHRDSGGY